MRVRRFSLARLRDDEQGAVLAIVAITLLALLGVRLSGRAGTPVPQQVAPEGAPTLSAS